MKRTLIIAVFALLVLANAKEADTVAVADELAVYQALFSGRQAVAVIRPDVKVQAGKIPLDSKEQPGYIAYLKEQLPGAETATIDAYLHSRIAPALLAPASDIGVKLEFVGQKDLDAIFRHPKIVKDTRHGYRIMLESVSDAEMAVFKKRFSADGLTAVSRVGFNADKTQALVHVWENWQAWTYLLEKVDGKWVIKDKVMEVPFPFG